MSGTVVIKISIPAEYFDKDFVNEYLWEILRQGFTPKTETELYKA